MSECDPKLECVVCGEERMRFREKPIVTLDEVKREGDLVRFYMAGSSTIHALIWGKLEQHCHANMRLPIPARTLMNAFLFEDYMDREAIGWSKVADSKHPWCMGPGEIESPETFKDSVKKFYEDVPIQTRELELRVVFDVPDMKIPPVVIIPADPRYFENGVPALRFGFVDRLHLQPEAIERFVLPKYYGHNIAGARACIIDVRISFTVDGADFHQELDQSWFDRNLFFSLEGAAEPVLDQNTIVALEKSYLERIRKLHAINRLSA